MSKNTSGQAPVEPAVHPLLARIARLNRVVVLLVTLAFLLLALFSPPALGGLLLLVLAGCLIALATSTWQVQNMPTRVLRVTVITVLVLTALSKLFA
jgi:hypothetical protein